MSCEVMLCCESLKITFIRFTTSNSSSGGIIERAYLCHRKGCGVAACTFNRHFEIQKTMPSQNSKLKLPDNCTVTWLIYTTPCTFLTLNKVLTRTASHLYEHPRSVRDAILLSLFLMRRPKFELPAVPGPFPELSGSVPGVLDPDQPSRLLRTPQSTLSFASFDPEIAVSHGLSRLSNLSLNDEERCRAKRIVIETIPGHGSFWRWVPRARKRDHVFDEGTFPRLVDICG